MNEEKINEVNSMVRSKSRSELIAMCKDKNIAYSGTKHDMAVRLLGGWNRKEEDNPRLSAFFRKIIIEKNEAGLYTYEGLVFDEKTKNVIGVWKEGAVAPLSRESIELCKKYKFRFVLPDVLDENPLYERADHPSSDEEEDEEEDDVEEAADPLSF